MSFACSECVRSNHPYIYYRVRGAKQLGKRVIDVDGSYLYRKQLQLESSGVVVCAPLPPPTFCTTWMDSGH